MTHGSSCHLCCHLRVSSAVRVAFHRNHVAFASQCGRLSIAVRVSIAVTGRLFKTLLGRYRRQVRPFEAIPFVELPLDYQK
jgi:hypothetical protein